MIAVPESKVNLYAAALHAKHDGIDGMTARIDKATALVLAGDVQADGGKFLVMSSRGDGTGYTVAASGCTCPDYANGAPRLGAGRWCKHRLAVAMIKRHIREAAQPRIQVGDAVHSVRVPLIKARDQSPFLYRVSEELTDYNKTTIKLGWSDQIFDFQPASDSDYIALARWLEAAPPLPLPKPSIFNEWRKDANANDATVMPFLEWQQLYADLRH